MGYLKLKYVKKYNSAILKMGQKLLKKVQKKVKNILDMKKSVYICSERLRGTDNHSIKFYLLNKNVLYDKKI